MIVPGSANPLLLASAAAAGGYQIERSLRFNSADSAYLSRTPASAGNRKTWTWAGWVKLAAINSSTQYSLFSTDGNTDTTFGLIAFFGNNIVVGGYNINYLVTSSVYRDTGAWMHIVVAMNTTQAAASNRLKVYANGSEITAFSTDSRSSISQNSDQGVNQAVSHAIGRQNDLTGSKYFNGYLADIHFIDGQALTPSSFGQFDTNNIWQPKTYTGTYGTNGFQLKFADNSNNTATTLGKDTSPNGNNWTPNNLSVTAGAGNDSLVDSPTNYGIDTGAGGNVRGNYCTLNPLDNRGLVLVNGNLDLTTSSASDLSVRGTIGVSSGKWYWEITASDIVAGGGTGHKRGVMGITLANVAPQSYVGVDASSWGYISHDGRKINNNTASTYGATWVTGDVIGIAFDADNGSLTFYKNGASQGVAFSGLAAGTYLPAFNLAQSGAAVTANFGQRPFAYTAPSGFKALCTQNLPTPTITNGATVFDTKLYIGNGSTQTISGLGFSPDLVWIKSRSGATDHALYDVVRGAEKRLESNTTDAEVTSDGGLTAFNSDGFALSTLAQVNTNSSTYVSWAWDAGSSTVTNTQGSITSQVRANASAGFSVVTYSAGASGSTVGHGLGLAPHLIVAKSRTNSSGAQPWVIYHISLGKDKVILFDTSAAVSLSNYWGSTGPTSTTFGVSTNTFANNDGNMVAYCWAPVAGYSSFGSYTGNGSADGPFVYTGFRPALVIVKMSSSTGNWTILDYQREGYNVDNDPLFPNLSNAEGTTDLIDLTSNGFKVRTTDATFNTNAGTYVYAAWAQNPFQYARAR